MTLVRSYLLFLFVLWGRNLGISAGALNIIGIDEVIFLSTFICSALCVRDDASDNYTLLYAFEKQLLFEDAFHDQIFFRLLLDRW
jgi:hypothetical protein